MEGRGLLLAALDLNANTDILEVHHNAQVCV